MTRDIRNYIDLLREENKNLKADLLEMAKWISSFDDIEEELVYIKAQQIIKESK